MRRRWRNFAHAILLTRKSFFHVFWNSIPTICWPRCICSARWNTNKLRRTKRGKRSKFSKRNSFFTQRPKTHNEHLHDFGALWTSSEAQNKGLQNHRRCVEESP